MQISKRNRRSSTCCGGLQSLLPSKLFKALSDPKRVSLMVRLAEKGEPCTVGQVAEGSGVDLSVVSRHLAILREAGIITCVKRAKEVWCVVRTDGLVKVFRDLADALEACCPDGCPMDESAETALARRPVSPKRRTRG